MEKRQDWRSILPYLPVVVRFPSLFWPSQVVESLKELECGRVDSGRLLFIFMTELRNSLSLSTEPLAPSAAHGYALFFDEVKYHTGNFTFLKPQFFLVGFPLHFGDMDGFCCL